MTNDAKTFDARHLKIAAVSYAVVGLGLYAAFPRSWTVGPAALFGPFAGPSLREWEHSLGWAWTLAPFAFGLLALGVLVQVLVAPTSAGRRRARWTAWGVACTGWFLFALLSCAVALE